MILGCESKIDKDIASYDAFPEDFEVFRKDRTKSGGGVFIAVRNDIIANHEVSLDKKNEFIWVSIQLSDTQKLYIGSYCRPEIDGVDFINELEAAIGQIHQSAKGKHPNIILGGDFNCADAYDLYSPLDDRLCYNQLGSYWEFVTSG